MTYTPTSDTYNPQLVRMVDRQICARSIDNPPLIQVMKRIPRATFIPPERQEQAYEDCAVPIGSGQTISQPFMVAYMTDKLDLKPHHRVLEIGTGCGYQTAILAELAGHVYTVERLEELSRRASQTLDSMNITNVTYLVGDGTEGWPEHAPYDRIIITAGAPDIPEHLYSQLSHDGILIIPTGPEESQTLKRIHKTDSGPVVHDLLACRFVKLIGQHGWDA